MAADGPPESRMAPRADPPPQRRVTRWTKFLLFVTAVIFIVASVIVGWVFFGSSITPLAVYLVARTLIQTVRARRHLIEMRRITRTPLVEAVISTSPVGVDMSWLRRESLRQHYLDWRQKIWDHPSIGGRLPVWQQIVDASFADYQSLPTAGAVVPTYGLEPEELRATLDSLKEQTYAFDVVVVCLNEPKNQTLREAIDDYVTFANWQSGGRTQWHFIDLPTPGKRGAMAAGFVLLKRLGVDIVVNVDADTVADVDALANTVRTFLEDPACHLITSDVEIKNIERNRLWGQWLVQWTFYRYKYANLRERAGQRRNVTCGSGPWLALLAQDMDEEFFDAFLNHEYGGVPVRPGDDRFITRILNRRRLGTMLQPDVNVQTDCPTEWRRFAQQQSRWAQSAQINFFQMTIPPGPKAEIWTLTPWSISDTLYLGFFTYLVLGVFLRVIVTFTYLLTTQGIEAAWWYLVPYAVMFGLSNLYRGVYAALTQRHIFGMVDALYFLPMFALIVPIKLKRNFNLTDRSWGGRKETT